jgi:hypothetical protein
MKPSAMWVYLDFVSEPLTHPDPNAEQWVSAGPVLRNNATGHVFGPPLSETRPKGGNTFGPEEKHIIWLIRALWICSAAFLFFSARSSGAQDDMVGAIVLSLVFLVVCFFLTGWLLSDLKTRALAGFGVSIGLLLLHVPLVIVLGLVALTSYAIFAYYRSPGMINHRLKQSGYHLQRALPANFSGRLKTASLDQQWEKGKPVGRYHVRYSEDPTRPQDVIQTFYEPYATPEYPYGWVMDASVPGGFVPRQSDPLQSPVPPPFENEPVSNVYGDNWPMPDEALRNVGALHAAPRKSTNMK